MQLLSSIIRYICARNQLKWLVLNRKHFYEKNTRPTCSFILYAITKSDICKI